MPDGIVWYREHDSQEINSVRKFVIKYEKIVLDYLDHPQCPLTEEQCKLIVRKRKRQSLRFALVHLLKLQLGRASDNIRIWLFYQRSK